MKTLVRLSSLVLLLSALPLFAQSMDWSRVGSTGIIDEDSLTLFGFTAYDLEFKTGQTGTITARYPVMHTGNPVPGWTLFYAGGSGPGVNVKLIENSECIPSTPTVICETGASTAGGNFCTPCSDFVHELDFVNNAYYFEVTMTRATTSTNPKLHMLAIE
ncbi:MAG TPA: hypothetical protein VF787_24420 [Thermoanaerobaculia bacterium]